MAQIVDCFLFHDEIELLEIRLAYLADIVDRFVIVTSSQTFTGLPRQSLDLCSNPRVSKYLGRVQVVHLETLIGSGPWEREAYSRDAIAVGLVNCQNDDIVIISDIDELPRASTLDALRNEGISRCPTVLALDYFNFKFNYKMISGVQAVWAGPIVCRYADFTSAQELRKTRWNLLDMEGRYIEDAGWHFSYLSSNGGLASKLRSYSHQEVEVQNRVDCPVEDLIERREGFHDHMHAGSVWAVVPLESLESPELENLVRSYDGILACQPADNPLKIEKLVRRSIRRIYDEERTKVLASCSTHEIATQLFRNLKRRFS